MTLVQVFDFDKQKKDYHEKISNPNLNLTKLKMFS